MKDKFELSLLESGNLLKRGGEMLVNNVGRIIAIITLTVSALILFTDVGFSGFESKSFTSTLTVMLIASYLMYFSMADAGERLGEGSDEYKLAIERYRTLSEKIDGDKIPALREFLSEYASAERDFRRSTLLLRYGYGTADYEAYQRGEACDKIAKKIFKKADRIRPVVLTPRELLTKDGARAKSELKSPEGTKFLNMILRLIPTTLCMTVTVSVMLTAKENLSAAAVMEGIFKLASLPVIGFRGYAAGYQYTKHTLPIWMATKARLLDAFLKSRHSISQQVEKPTGSS
ncbi:MAG: hypothetical protein J6V09_03310 [Clostridia bacterium]|nr:hypothetical protein [Clostridia bacterium]